MKVLLTGHMGFIGSHTLDALLAYGHEVHCLDDGSSGRPQNLAHLERQSYTITTPGDIRSPMVLRQAFENFEPDAVIHLAAQPSLLRSYEEPLLDQEINTTATLMLAMMAKEWGLERFVFASTSAVYRSESRPPFVEWHTPLEPTRPYGISKHAAECYVRAFAPNPCILRYGNVYGPRQIPVGENQLVPRVLSFIYNNKEFDVYGDGEQTRDFIFVDDVANANVMALESQRNGTFNIGTGKGTSVTHIINELRMLTGYGGYFNHVNAKPGEPSDVVLDISRAGLFLNWRPRVNIEDGIKTTARWWLREMIP